MSFEAHVTIEPVFDERFDCFEALCKAVNFKPAHLLMQKSRAMTAIRSDKDTFCTGHDVNYDFLLTRLLGLVAALKAEGFGVWRYKIEGILLDVRLPELMKIKDLARSAPR